MRVDMAAEEPSSEPPIPEEPPKVALDQLRGCLLLPFIIVCLAQLAIHVHGDRSFPPDRLLPSIALITLVIFTAWFVVICRVRFHERSLVLMSLGYVMLQSILVTPVLIGAGVSF